MISLCDHLLVTNKSYQAVLVLFIMLYKVVLTSCLSVDEILKCDHSSGSY